MQYENVLILGYLTNPEGVATRPVIGMPFIPRTLHVPEAGDKNLQFEAFTRKLGVTEKEIVIYDCTTLARDKKNIKKFSLVILKPGYREQVREFLKGGIVWVSTGGLEEHLEVMRRGRARLYRSYILGAGSHNDVAIFAEILKNSMVGK